jgi:hypothetical protein
LIRRERSEHFNENIAQKEKPEQLLNIKGKKYGRNEKRYGSSRLLQL